jgi:CheY-like chemotaxis protein
MHDPSPARGSPGLVLLAEDQPVNQRVAMAMLENLGYHVDVVADGAGAVEAAALTHYRAILMDCQLPVLDGHQATEAIRAREDPDRRTPIIAVTATGTEFDQQRCRLAGMDDCLTKPLTLRTLGAVMDRWGPDGSGLSLDLDRGGAAADEGPPAPSHTVLDAHVVARLERLGSTAGVDLMARLITLFLAESDASIVAMREAVAGRDAVAVQRWAHALSGASANLGATEMARLCGTFASGGATDDREGMPARFDAIEAELGRVRAALHAWTPAS